MARLYKLIFLLVLILPVSALAWDSGQNHTYTFSALTGGGNGALDSLAGVSIGALDRAIVQTGTTFYFYENLDTGTTVGVESSPMRIVPDDLQAGGTGLTGTSTWALTALSGDTVEARALYVDATRWDDGSGGMSESVVRSAVSTTVLDKATDTYVVTESDPVYSGDPAFGIAAGDITNWDNAFGWGDHGLVGYLTGTTNHATSHEAGGDWEMQLSDMASGVSDLMDKTGDAGMISNWDTAYGWGDHSTVGYLTGTTNHAALHAPGGDWDLSTYYLSGTTDHHALHEAGGAWELDIGNLASGTSRVFDKATDVITYIDGTAWRVLYTDASGNVSELALGANGTYLKSQGAAAAPAWDTPAGGGGGGSGLTTFRTGEDGSEAESATVDDAPGGMFLMGNESGVSITASGSTVFYTVPKTIAYGWATVGAGMSTEGGVSTPPIRVRWDCLVERVTVSSLRAGATSGVSIAVFYNASAPPNSGETVFNVGDTGKPGSTNAYSKDWISAGTEFVTGGYVAFMPHTCGSGVTRATITVDVRTQADGN